MLTINVCRNAGISWKEKVCQQVHNVTKYGNIEMNLGFVTHLIY